MIHDLLNIALRLEAGFLKYAIFLIFIFLFYFLNKLFYFQVDHFSKYGLSDTDEEDNIPTDPKKAKLVNQNTQMQQKQQQQSQQQGIQLIDPEVKIKLIK